MNLDIAPGPTQVGMYRFGRRTRSVGGRNRLLARASGQLNYPRELRPGVGQSGERYALRGGRPGYERLQVLARERWADTERLFDRAGIGPGMDVIDLGCGGGAVSIEIARRVGPAGHVVGLDMDAVKLDLARTAAAELGVGNVEFRVGSVRDWDEPDRFDAVYSRFLLQHLREPNALLRTMWRAVRAGGVLVVEDADHEGWSLSPPDPAFDFFLSTMMEVIRRGGGDPTYGRKLYDGFLESKIPDPVAVEVRRTYRTGGGREMPVNTLESISDSAVEMGIATRANLEENVRRLKAVLAEGSRQLLGPRFFQVFATRPVGSAPERSAPSGSSRG